MSKGDRSWSSTHYGTDFGKSDGLGGLDTNLYALGVGTVIRRVWNHDMGNILQVLYENVLMPDNSKKDIVALYAHLERPSDFVEGSSVYISETPIAVIGGTGEYGGGVVNSHLHLELADYNVTVDHDRQGEMYPTETLPGLRSYFASEGGELNSYAALDILYRQDSTQKVAFPPAKGNQTGMGGKLLMDLNKILEKNEENPLK